MRSRKAAPNRRRGKSSGWIGINNPFNGQPVVGVGWGGGGKGKASTVSAPSAIGVVLPTATFNFIGRPQANAEYDTVRGVRISGNGLMSFAAGQVHTPLPTPPLLNVGCLTSDVAPGGVQWYYPIVPQNVDPRLTEIVKTFQFFAFRSLSITYVPAVGTQSTNSIAFGFSQDAEEYLQIPFPTQQQVLEFNTTYMGPVWQTGTLTYNHPGTKVWQTNSPSLFPGGGEAGPVNSFYQAQFAGVVSQSIADLPPGSLPTNTPLGQFYVRYVIDLYEPQPVLDIKTLATNPPSGVFTRGHHGCCDEKDEEGSRPRVRLNPLAFICETPRRLPPRPPCLERESTCHFAEFPDIEELPLCLSPSLV